MHLASLEPCNNLVREEGHFSEEAGRGGGGDKGEGSGK